MSTGLLFQIEPLTHSRTVVRVFFQQFGEVVKEEPLVVLLADVGVDAWESLVKSGTRISKSQITVPVKKLKLAILSPSIHIAILTTAQGNGIPVVNITSHHEHLHDGVRVGQLFHLLLGVASGSCFKELNQGAEIILRFPRSFHPLGPIGAWIVGVFKLPRGIPMLPIPRVSKPPLIIDPVEFAIGPIFKVSIQKFIAYWFGIFPELG